MLDLKGMTTNDGWLIQEPAAFAPDHTGGYFSQCYFVERDERRAFLKALDIEKFPLSQLLPILAGFQYEGDLFQLCKDQHLSRIVRVLERGEIDRDPTLAPVLRYVPYMVFELADGDIRGTVDASKSATNQWRFYVLHQAALALIQLHGRDIAHQDLKPSNVLKFDKTNAGAAVKIKLGDLGRSSRRGVNAPHDGCIAPGALNYAPFEQRYSYVLGDWRKRRISADVFHLGCLAVFAFTNVCFPEYIMVTHMADAYRPENWSATYPDVQAHVTAAMIAALNDLQADFPEEYRSDLVSIVLDLCHPDPERRGRMSSGLNPLPDQLWLQPFVARFDALEKRSRIRKPHHAGATSQIV